MSSGSAPTTKGPELLTLPVPANSIFIRIHQIKDGPLWFGPALGSPPAYRFDAPAGEYRTLYAAQTLEGAFAETVLRGGKRIIARAYVELRGWSIINNLRPLRLLKLYDEGLLYHGVTADICAGDTYREPQEFARRFHAAYPDLDGIAYRARHNNGQICYALFDRVQPTSLSAGNIRKFSDERAMADALMRLHNASFDPVTPLPPP